MSRRAIAVVVFGFALVLWSAFIRIAPSFADVPVDEVHYTFAGPTSVTLDWRGTAQDVRYGLSTAYDSTATGAAPAWTPTSSPGPFQQAQIGGLAAGTTYHYSIGGGPDRTFHTPPTGDFRFDAIADIGDTTHFSHLADTLSAIAGDQPSLALMASDLMSAAQNDPGIHYIVTYGHRPAYSTGFHPGDATLAGILNGLGTTYSKYVLNINGHSHDYERFQPIDGVTHVTVGTPASEETPWGSTDPNTAFRALHLAHLRVDVDATGMRIQAVCDDAASRDDITCAPGSIIDEYTIGTPPAPPPVTAFYVDKTNAQCADTGPGDVATPYCTIAKGTSRLLPGQTLYIGNGTYAEQVSPPSGTATAPVTVTALAGASPTVTGTATQTHGIYLPNRSNVTVSGLTVSGAVSDGVYVTGGSNVTLSGLRVTGSGQPNATGFAKGFKVVGTTNSTMSGNTADHNTDSGIYLAQGSTGNQVVGNTAYANARQYTRAAPGIDLRSGGNTVRGNVVHDNEDSGIQLYTGSDGSLVANNVSYRNGDHGIDDYQAANERIISNSVYRNTTAVINLEVGSTGGLVENNYSVDS